MVEKILESGNRQKVATAFTLFFALVGVTGSFMLSFQGNSPCVYCWTARVSMILIAILNATALYRETVWLHVASAIAVIPSIVASGILVKNDYFPNPICTSPSEYCFSPLFFGIHASLYALVLSFLILAGSIYSIYLFRNSTGEKAAP